MSQPQGKSKKHLWTNSVVRFAACGIVAGMVTGFGLASFVDAVRESWLNGSFAFTIVLSGLVLVAVTITAARESRRQHKTEGDTVK